MKKEFLTEAEAAQSRHMTDVMSGLPDYVNEYVNEREEEGCSIGTLSTHLRVINILFNQQAAKIDISAEKVSIDDLRKMSPWDFDSIINADLSQPAIRNKTKSASDSYKKQRWAGLIDFFDYLQRKDYVINNIPKVLNTYESIKGKEGLLKKIVITLLSDNTKYTITPYGVSYSNRVKDKAITTVDFSFHCSNKVMNAQLVILEKHIEDFFNGMVDEMVTDKANYSVEFHFGSRKMRFVINDFSQYRSFKNLVTSIFESKAEKMNLL